ncbi:hypothetical protein AXF42_Ash021200 [Apostasia shenzhenica]|uniref:Uncharacterized protein n=1 Tax=Apostasia shenzhenica TaxID=1088818 RepID=A0A2I0AXC8_9ASPA|nr:hypothetical protein AXF42_Ash021200 [Apostasia shenzhenica]
MAEKLLSIGTPPETVPESYVRPETQRPNFAVVETDGNIPVVDLSSGDKFLIAQVRDACCS